jgi:hypothetical protein
VSNYNIEFVYAQPGKRIQAESHEDAVRQYVAYLTRFVGTTIYRVEEEDGPTFEIDAQEL